MIFYPNQVDALITNTYQHYNIDKNVDLADIKKFVVRRHRRNGIEICIHELGVGNYRFDFLSLNPYSQKVRIFEYKTNRADFVNDKKWRGYLPYCNTLAFVTPLGLINVKDLPTGVGLLQVFKWQRTHQTDSRQWLGAVWCRKPHGRQMTIDRYYQVMGMLLVRLVQGRKDDFF